MDEAFATETVDLGSLPGRFKPFLNLVLTLILCCVLYIQWDSVTVKPPPVQHVRLTGWQAAVLLGTHYGHFAVCWPTCN